MKLIPYFFRKLEKMSKDLSSAAVMRGYIVKLVVVVISD